ncbi:prefoldin subunit 5 [Xiphias gladius]|uniref:prefoldin subunit 5 n=1 Tax=Xiphias gladius TaxID=8245 RepID=UPI001A989101|nr:prefoldin subunit 5 [Xiphias gladius]
MESVWDYMTRQKTLRQTKSTQLRQVLQQPSCQVLLKTVHRCTQEGLCCFKGGRRFRPMTVLHPETQSQRVIWHRASNMAVNLTDLSLSQLEGLKTQLDQEIEFLTSSIGQLKVVQTKYVEAKDSLNVLNKNNKGKELLVPLTSSMYVPGTLNDVEHVLVDVGTGYYVEKNVDDSKAFFKRKIDFLTKQIEKIQPALQEKHAMKQAVIEVMNAKIQQLQQSQQTSQMVATTKA